MKRTICLALILSLVICSTIVGIAAENNSIEVSAENNLMEFTGEEIKLSLEDAKKMMLTQGVDFEIANLNLRANRAKTRHHFEEIARSWIDPITRERRQPSRTTREMTDLSVEFAREQTPKNYEAELNKITRNVVRDYYTLAHLKEAVRISNENVAIQERVYQNTVNRVNLGIMARSDLLAAEIGLNEAKVRAESAEIGYANLRMAFNIAFGYELIQNITLTDTLEEVEPSDISLEDAIALALENRNEIHGAAYNVKLKELELRETGNSFSRSSATYLNVAVALMGAQLAYDNAPKNVERDVRANYMDMIQKHSEVELRKLGVANAKEVFRLTNLRFEAGMVTLVEVQQAQLMAFNAELDYYKALLDYNLAIIDYELSTTVGIQTASF